MYKRISQGWLKHVDFVALDMLALQLAYVLAYYIRYHRWWPYAFSNYRMLGVLLLVFDLMVTIVFNTMHNVIRRGYFLEFVQSLKQAILVLATMSVYLFSTQTGDVYSRITIYLTAGFHLVFGYLLRLAWKPLVKRLNRGRVKNSVILVADEAAVPEIQERCSDLDDFEYAGLILTNRDAPGETIHGLKVVAAYSDAADYICREHVDEVFVHTDHLADLSTSRTSRLIDQCREMAVPIHVRIPISDVGGKSFIEKVGGYNVLTASANYASPVQIALKRLMDIIGGLFGSLAALIVIAIVGPKIKKESPGPILFKQTRIGLNGKRFVVYKIRSMYMDAEERKKDLMAQNRVADGMMFKMDFDPRIIGNKIVDGKQVTGIGEFIRSSSLDEFPQFFNILKGDMSLVGTRPPTEDEWEKYKYHHRARLATKPGLTGLWQVSGRSRITDFEEVVKLDTKYIYNWSLGLDLKILLKTVKAVLKKDGAI